MSKKNFFVKIPENLDKEFRSKVRKEKKQLSPSFEKAMKLYIKKYGKENEQKNEE